MKITMNKLYLILFIMVIPWLYLMHTLMIADVWDETNFLLALQLAPFSEFSLLESIQFFWTNKISIYRPLPMSVVLIIEQFAASDFVYFRYFNIIMLLLSLIFLSQSLHNFFTLNTSRIFAFFVIALYSSSFLITGGWFANIFDALSLFFISVGIFLLSKEKYTSSAVVIGLSFFCKEISIIVIPFLGFILYQKKSNYKKLIIPAVIVILLGTIYAVLRQMFIPLGSSDDLHTFDAETFLPSFLTFLQSFWWQHIKFSQNSADAWLGLIVFVLSIAAVKGSMAKFFAGLIVMLAALAYWNMFNYQDAVIVNSINFIARLYLIPSIMVLYIISVKADKATLIMIGLLMFSGTAKTYLDYRQFQEVYAEIYQLAHEQSGDIFVHYPEKVLSDPQRNIYIGYYPDSNFRIDIDKAKLIR